MLQVFNCNCVLCFRHWRRDGRRWDRRNVHWRREREIGAQETSCCYQTTGTDHSGAQHCLPAANSSQDRVNIYWRRHLMMVYFVLIEFYSSILPRLLHAFNSYFPALDQYSGDPSSSINQATGHQLVSLCRSVVEEENNQLLSSLMTS